MKRQAEDKSPAAEMRRLAEMTLSERSSNLETALERMPPEAIRQLLHELQVHQIELEMQNEELRRTREELENSRARYFDLYDLAPVGYYSLDRNGIILEANLTAAKMTGLERASIVAQPFSQLVAPESQDALYLFWQRVLQLGNTVGKNQEVELRLRRADNPAFSALVTLRPTQGYGRQEAYRLIVTDISDRVRIENENIRLGRENERSQRLQSLGTLAAGIAHDFNNLLTGVFGNLELALKDLPESPATGRLQLALTALERTSALTRQLMTFAKGGEPLQKTGYLFPFVRESTLFALSGSNIVSKFEIPDNIWPCNFDVNQIGQVIDNLVTNARQAMPDGGFIEINAENILLIENQQTGLPAGNFVHLTIRDSGPGIAPDLLPRIFDPFFTTKAESHGLGLATCYSIMQRHGGLISAEVSESRGMIFHLFLPAVPAITVAPPNSLPEKTEITRAGGCIVVVDDEAAVRDVLTHMLIAGGYTVENFSDCRDAIVYLQEIRKQSREIAAIILDLTIPGGMGGIEGVAEIRKFDARTPVIAMSGYSDAPAIANPSAFGFTASLAKPFTIAALSQIISQVSRKPAD